MILFDKSQRYWNFIFNFWSFCGYFRFM